MDLALQRRRFFIAMAITVAALVVALAAAVGMFGLHLAWAIWVFAAALLVGFASHAWLMLGLFRDRAAPSA
jgi:uncharacterized membrane protein YdbT with pleckstrin-like domain